MDILKRLADAGVLEGVLLIGSWCAGFYKEYFKDPEYNPRIRTRDIDFLLPIRPRFKSKVDLEELLGPLGFEMEFYGKGYMKLESDELALEFLIPEVGPHKEKPHEVPALKFNAQPMRHMSTLWRSPVRVNIDGIDVILPHPADFCVQKLVIAGRRKGASREKGEKDRQTAFEVLDSLLKSDNKIELEKAIEAYRRSLELNPKNAGYHSRLGLALKDKGKLEDALASFQEAYRQDPDYAEAYCNAARMLCVLHRFEDAVKMFEKGHEIGTRQ